MIKGFEFGNFRTAPERIAACCLLDRYMDYILLAHQLNLISDKKYESEIAWSNGMIIKFGKVLDREV